MLPRPGSCQVLREDRRQALLERGVGGVEAPAAREVVRSPPGKHGVWLAHSYTSAPRIIRTGTSSYHWAFRRGFWKRPGRCYTGSGAG